MKEPEAGSPQETVLDLGAVKLAWGAPARWKARWRDDALKRHLASPIGDRLRRSLSLVLVRANRERRAP
jgi:hypothetical protein